MSFRSIVSVAFGMFCLAGSACGAKSTPSAAAVLAKSNREACAWGKGDAPSKTLADFPYVGDKIPIDHIVLIMQENRSFDSYYSHLTVPGQTVDAASDTQTNPNAVDGGTIQRFHQTAYCFDDTSHGWQNEHIEFDNGANDGFPQANEDPPNDPSGARSMGYYDGTDLPYYYALANAFSISDRHFCSVLGPTYPNREYYMAGTSFGQMGNDLDPKNPDGTQPSIYSLMSKANVTWKVYADDLPTIAILTTTYSEYSGPDHIQPSTQFEIDAAAGTLPSVSFVEGSDLKGGVSPDEHPPADPQVGQARVATEIAALMSSPLWSRSALFLTYDENGGLYDHVPPPPACSPDDDAALEGEATDAGAPNFAQYGFRTPLLVVSPWAKRGYVSHQLTDHTSILRFVEARFGLTALTHRDGNAEPPFDMFDFSKANTTVPTLPAATIDATNQMSCVAEYPPADTGL